MTGLKIVAGLLAILLAIPHIVFLYMVMKMEKEFIENGFMVDDGGTTVEGEEK